MERAGRLIAQMDLPPQVADAEVCARAAWPVAAGKKIARHTRAVALVRETLVVEVGDVVWQRQLSTLRHFLLRNLAKELGGAVVKEIDFRPMPRRRGPQRAESSRPSARNADEAESIQDPVLSLLYKRSRGSAG